MLSSSLKVAPKLAESHKDIPTELRKRSLEPEYIDMGELSICRTAIMLSPSQSQKCNEQSKTVTGIVVWVEWCSSLATVLSSKYPNFMGEFLSYQHTVIKVKCTSLRILPG